LRIGSGFPADRKAPSQLEPLAFGSKQRRGPRQPCSLRDSGRRCPGLPPLAARAAAAHWSYPCGSLRKCSISVALKRAGGECAGPAEEASSDTAKYTTVRKRGPRSAPAATFHACRQTW